MIFVARAIKPFLEQPIFETVIDAAPLISIDLVVRNESGKVLLGLRNNKPAQGYWFVPGGRIFKNESLADAFKRLTKVELGIELLITNAKYLGLYEHFYDDCVFDSLDSPPKTSTHYVVNGFEIILPAHITELPKDQHNQYQWFNETDLIASENVHLHSKWYFDKDQGFL
jgi:colanic acid biosynthesis protein WcaH